MSIATENLVVLHVEEGVPAIVWVFDLEEYLRTPAAKDVQLSVDVEARTWTTRFETQPIDTHTKRNQADLLARKYAGVLGVFNRDSVASLQAIVDVAMKAARRDYHSKGGS